MLNEIQGKNIFNESDNKLKKQVWVAPTLKILDISETAQPGAVGNDGQWRWCQGMAGS